MNAGTIATSVIFLVIGVVMFFIGLIVSPHALTDDGYNLRYFMFLMGGFFALIGIIMPAIGGLFFFLRRRKIENLLATGQRGTAKILQVKNTGITINDNPRLNFLLEMHFENYPPYQVWKKVTVAPEKMPAMQVGSSINVLADPDDPQNSRRIVVL